MQEFLERVAAEWPIAFPDIPWTNKPLLFKIPSTLRYIKIELQEENWLHLDCIELFAIPEQGGKFTRIQTLDASVTMSSCYRQTPHLASGEKFLKQHNHYGIHTEFESNPWIIIDLGSETRVDVVKLFNRADTYADRAKTIRISISADRYNWNEIYNAVRRRAELLSWLTNIYDNTIDSPSGVDLQRFLKFTDALILRNIKECNSWIAELSPNAERLKHLNRIASLYSLEITTHGLRTSFRFWNDGQKRDYIRFCNQLITHLRDLSDLTTYGFGFVLGIVRDGDFIPHDDDIDILLVFRRSQIDTLSKGLQILEDHLRTRKYLVEGSFISHRWVRRDQWQADVFIGIIEDDDEAVSIFPSARRLHKKGDIFPCSRLDFLGEEILIPCNALKYVEKTYGKLWRTPNNLFSHPWDVPSYNDIL